MMEEFTQTPNTKNDQSQRYTYRLQSAPNNSNETYTFMCRAEPVIFVSAKTALKFKYEIEQADTNII